MQRYRSEYSHDSAGRLVETKGPGTSRSGVSGGMRYDLLNRPKTSVCHMRGSAAEDPTPPFWYPALPDNPVSPGPIRAIEIPSDIDYTAMGRVLSMEIEADYDFQTHTSVWEREHVATYDELGRMTSKTVTSNEYGGYIDRGFDYAPDWVAGQYTRTGPDGVETFVQLDTANRVQSYRRGPANDPVLTATYTYYNDDRVHTVSFGNGASITYTYDDARRLTSIEHRDLLATLVMGLSYNYYANDLPSSRVESDSNGPTATVAFTYDYRGRLLVEERTGDVPYHFSYEYDQVGNREMKTDLRNDVSVGYTYDIVAPEVTGSNNNRLLRSTTFDVSSGLDPLSTTYYYYNPSGNVTRVVTNPYETYDYSATRFVYASNGQAVLYVMGETWKWEGGAEDPVTNYTVTYIREFRYDGARQRYLNRELEYDPQTREVIEVESVWSDYDGDTIYGDFEAVEDQVQGWIAEELRSFEPAIGKVDPWSPNGGGGLGGIANSYYHGDMIGTTRLMTNAAGSAADDVTYTAFGERIDGTNHRYGYAGSSGYQAHDEFPYLHVGARYYDPSSGRFLQRDPIGLFGGLNVYGYVGNSPGLRVDPSGLTGCRGKTDFEVWVEYQQRMEAQRGLQPPPEQGGFGAKVEVYHDSWLGCNTPVGGTKLGVKESVTFDLTEFLRVIKMMIPLMWDTFWSDINRWQEKAYEDWPSDQPYPVGSCHGAEDCVEDATEFTEGCPENSAVPKDKLVLALDGATTVEMSNVGRAIGCTEVDKVVRSPDSIRTAITVPRDTSIYVDLSTE